MSSVPARKKSLGQHFLNSGRTVIRMIDALCPEPDMTVVEIGPGRGALTRELASGRGALTRELASVSNDLVLVEMDSDLIPLLRQNFPTARIVEGDAGALDTGALAPPDRRVVCAGNLPYNAGGRILFNFLTGPLFPVRMVFMFQKEVAIRLCASPGDREFGAVSLLVNLMARTKYLFDVPPSRFIPPPAVMSGVVLFDMLPRLPDTDFLRGAPFATFAHAIFAQPRKTIVNSMMKGLSMERTGVLALLEAGGVDPAVRPCLVNGTQAVAMFDAWSMGNQSSSTGV